MLFEPVTMLFISIKESTVKYIPPSVSIKLFLWKPNLLVIFSDINIYFITSNKLIYYYNFGFLLSYRHILFSTFFIKTNSSWPIFESIKALQFKTSMLFNLDFASNTSL